ncbi:uncharacterized protein LOC115210500 [Octopus sinensis]|uniref:Uncharacterized protein LOC115210500 n=1 Tax=Octopus sinensis TaxID=2607531 RepID=A0A6P7SA51_9MOLL|nr:uncharacterized protein LOC115210500 [Octopus sinensis]
MRLCSIKRPPACQKFDTNKIGPSYAVEIRNRFELLAIEENQEAEEIWENVKEIVVETAEKHVLYKKPTRSAKWISEETYVIAEERRRTKMTRSRDEVRRLNAMFQQAARKDKGKYWNEECARAGEAYRKGNMRELYQHVKKTRTAFMARQATIRGRNGKELDDQEENNLDEQAEEKRLELEPNILDDEVVRAMKQLANRKAPGTDGIPLELLKPIPTKTLTSLCQRIWRTCKWPREWKRSVFIPIPKKGDTKDCANYCTITLIPHVSKILLKIIQKRLNTTIERELPEVQAGFRKERSTRDHIANLRWIMEKAREYQKKLYMCFIGYSKVFDSIDHDKLWKFLEEMGTPLHLVQLIR